MTDRQVTVLSLTAEQSFADFYRLEHRGQVRRAYLLLGDSATAHDVVANAFVAVYQRWDCIDKPGPYLNRCVLNGCHDVGRRRVRERVADWFPAAVDGGATAEDEVDELSDILSTLPFRQRAAIVLRFYGGCSEAEIADQLGCRPGTVGSLIHRGLKVLRAQLATED
jgi:RNA polymerase sigma-70 factor (sigma-E family)